MTSFLSLGQKTPSLFHPYFHIFPWSCFTSSPGNLEAKKAVAAAKLKANLGERHFGGLEINSFCGEKWVKVMSLVEIHHHSPLQVVEMCPSKWGLNT